jgi:hypothetical protein
MRYLCRSRLTKSTGYLSRIKRKLYFMFKKKKQISKIFWICYERHTYIQTVWVNLERAELVLSIFGFKWSVRWGSMNARVFVVCTLACRWFPERNSFAATCSHLKFEYTSSGRQPQSCTSPDTVVSAGFGRCLHRQVNAKGIFLSMAPGLLTTRLWESHGTTEKMCKKVGTFFGVCNSHPSGHHILHLGHQ